LLSIQWTQEKECKEAKDLIKKWAEITFEEALPLLSYKFCNNLIYSRRNMSDAERQALNEIRQKAVDCLLKMPNADIQNMMLQIVQSYRYEDFKHSGVKELLFEKIWSDSEEDTIDEEIANSIHWHLFLESTNQENNEEMRVEYQLLYKEYMEEIKAQSFEFFKCIEQQKEFRTKMINCVNAMREGKGKIADKKKKLRQIISRN
jgi:hypothetical protein